MKKYILSYCLLIIYVLGFSHPVFFNSSFLSDDYNNNAADSIIGFNINHYDIYIDIDTSNQEIVYGFVVATVNPVDFINQISYELVGLNVDSVFVNNVLVEFTHENGVIVIPLDNICTQFTTKVVYSGSPQLSSDGYGNGMRFLTNQVFTVSCPNAARYWFPCYDHPWQKTLTDMRVKTRSDWKVASNGIRQGIINHEDGTSTTHWKNEEPIATYLVSIAMADYVEQSSYHNGLLVQNFVFPNQAETAQEAFTVVPIAIDVFNELYGEYPFAKYGNAVAAITNFAAMEHQTMTTIGSSYVNTSQTGEMVIVHELAHSWFGNSLTALTWKDVWLSEGFATYSEALFREQVYGFSESRDYIGQRFHNYYKNFASSYGYRRIYDPVYNEYFYPMVYQKAASVLNMLRLKIGHENYFNLIQTWFGLGHRNVVTAEFIELAEEVSGYDLDQFFNQWIFGTGYPNISHQVLYNPENNTIALYGKTQSPTETNFYIDLPVIFRNNENSVVIDSILVVASPQGNWTYYEPDFQISGQIEILIDENNWNLANYQSNIVTIDFDAFAGYDKVKLTWFDPESELYYGYNIYRECSNTSIKLNTAPILSNQYIDYSISPGHNYTYYLKPVIENNYELLCSLSTEVHTPEFIVTGNGILVIDETSNGNGTLLNPSNEQQRVFYDYVLSEQDFEYWDVSVQGFPGYDLIANYKYVLWYDDDLQNSQLTSTYTKDVLASYILSGGNLIVSGFKTAQAFNSNFLIAFTELHGTQDVRTIPNPVVSSVDGFSTLNANFDKIPSSWTYGLIGVNYFEVLSGMFFINTQNPSFEHFQNKVCGLNNDSFVLLGFPLYYFDENQVKSFINNLIDYLAFSDETILIPQSSTTFSVYPNPLSGAKSFIEIVNSKHQELSLDIYNIKGQKIKTLFNSKFEKGSYKFMFDMEDSDIKKISSGIYLFKLMTDNDKIVKKITLIK